MRIKYFNVLWLLILFLLVSCSGKANVESVSSPEGATNSTKKVTFIELGSVNCIPCKMMQPVMEQIENELGDQVEVVFHDVWTEEGKPYGQQYRIRVIPTQVFLNAEGNEYFRHEGFFPVEELYPVLEQGGVLLP